jgi:hypothetical protein
MLRQSSISTTDTCRLPQHHFRNISGIHAATREFPTTLTSLQAISRKVLLDIRELQPAANISHTAPSVHASFVSSPQARPRFESTKFGLQHPISRDITAIYHPEPLTVQLQQQDVKLPKKASPEQVKARLRQPGIQTADTIRLHPPIYATFNRRTEPHVRFRLPDLPTWSCKRS